MAGRIPVGSAVLLTSVVTAIGYGIMYVTTPTDQQFYDALAPDLKKKVDDARAAQGKALSQREKIEQIKRSAEAEAPVWADSFKKEK